MSALGDNIARTKLAVDCSAMLNTAKVQRSEARYRIGCYHAPAPTLLFCDGTFRYIAGGPNSRPTRLVYSLITGGRAPTADTTDC